MSEPENRSEELPAGLRGDLVKLYSPGRFPAERDARILEAVRRQARGSGTGWWRRYGVAAGIAAAVAVTAMVLWYPSLGGLGRARNAAKGGGGGAATVYQQTGDIRDAYYVARQLRMQRALDSRWDVNHDGVVNEGDVKSLAMAAVKIGKETR